jgi:hypothetical protein
MNWGTQATTQVSIPPELFIRTNCLFNCTVKYRFFKELLLHRLGIRPADISDVNLNNYVAMYFQRLGAMEDDRLAPGNDCFPHYITDASIEDEVRKRSKELLTDSIVCNPMLPGGSPRAMVTGLVDDLLRRNPHIRSVANIGAFVDNQCAYLAPRHPEVSFLSVDRYGDIEQLNRHFPQSPNWKFSGGYALDMLVNGALRADLFFMTSTSVCFTHRELDRYIEQFARSAKLVVFNEPWWPSLTSLNFLKIPRPEGINPSKPLLGLAYFNFQNNYVYFLEKHGFKVTTSRIIPTAGGYRWYTLQITATRSQK